MVIKKTLTQFAILWKTIYKTVLHWGDNCYRKRKNSKLL